MKRPIEELRRDIIFDCHVRSHSFTFHSTWGLFSPDALDTGSRLLLEHLELTGNETALDLGCGYGAMGVVIAKELTQGAVHLIDKDFVAVEYAKNNAELNGLKNTTAYLSNGFSHVPADIKFDLIVSNLPAKVGRELYDIFFYDAHQYLKPGGRIVVVTIAGLKEAIKKSFRETFGNYEKIKQSTGHIVSAARKE